MILAKFFVCVCMCVEVLLHISCEDPTRLLMSS